MSHTRALPASLAVVVVLLSTPAGARIQHGPPTEVPLNITRETVILAAERLEVEHTYPPLPPSRLGESVDVQILRRAEQSPVAAIREVFVRALGRFERPADVERIRLHVGDTNPAVREAAVRALAQALVHAKPQEDGPAIQMAFDVLRVQLATESNSVVAVAILQALGEVPLGGSQIAEAVRLFSFQIGLSPSSNETKAATILNATAAMQGLATLARHTPDVTVSADTRARLRHLAVPRLGGPDAGPPMLTALQVLDAIHDTDERTIVAAATYRCLPGPPACGWEIRDLAVQMGDPASSAFDRALHAAESDASYQVRMTALRMDAAAIPATKTCWPFIYALNDPVPAVVLRAIDLMSPACTERDDEASRLLAWATELADPKENSRWHRPAHAFEALAKFLPDDAKRIANETAAVHDVWQVRAAAARVARVLKDETLALRLMKDREPNVRTEALTALAQMRSAALVSAATDSLESKDYQLVLYAATFLNKVTLGKALADEFAARGASRLMPTLTRLTADDKDTSRDPRVALLGRVGQYGDPSDEEFMKALASYLKDVDPVVASVAADAIGALTGTRPDPDPMRRPVDQPTEVELREGLKVPLGLQPFAEILLTDGTGIVVNLALREAPLTVFRFKTLANQGYYNGLTFHRLVPALLIQGGSPGANEYVGTARFWPDEIGVPHMAGAVGLSTRGRHTGDGQFFVDFVDAPQFNHEYTVFGSASVPQSVQEGATIARITVFAPKPPLPVEPRK